MQRKIAQRAETVQELEKYRVSTRLLHWTHAMLFLVLALTGLFLFLPWFSDAAMGGWSRVTHRVAAMLFMATPLFFVLFNWRRSWTFIKEAFTWGKDDIGWLKAAPEYYFGIDTSKMPPQGHMNTGQKMYWLFTLVGGVVFMITGVLMWFFKGALPAGVFQWSVLVHDIAFIGVGSFFLVHFFLSVLHPVMTEAMKSMVAGKVSAGYAKSHHMKWYEEQVKGKND